MKQVYFSEKTKKTYESEEECVKAEKEYDDVHAAEEKAKAERKARAEEVNNAYKEMVDATNHYNELRRKFIKDYHSLHVTYGDDVVDSFEEAMLKLFKLF